MPPWPLESPAWRHGVALGSQEPPLIGKTRLLSLPTWCPPLQREAPLPGLQLPPPVGQALVPPAPELAEEPLVGQKEVSQRIGGGVPRSKPSGPSAFRGQDGPPALTEAPALSF